MQPDSDQVCIKVRPQLQDFLDGRLHGGAERTVSEHLECCPLCHRELAELATLVGLVGRLRQPAPSPDYWSRLYSRLEQATSTRRPGPFTLRPVVLLPALAALALALLIAGLLPHAAPQQTAAVPLVPLQSYLSEHFYVAGSQAPNRRVFLPAGNTPPARRVYLGDDGP